MLMRPEQRRPQVGFLLTFILCFALVYVFYHDVVSAQSLNQASDESQASEAISLPSLMSLGQALSLAAKAHPNVLTAESKMQSSEAAQQIIKSANDWAANLTLDAVSAELINNDSGFQDDSRASLSISKLLWDFGRSKAMQTAADLGEEGAQIALDYTTRLQRIEIMRAFFNVIAADHQYLADNEAMSLSFFPFNRAQDRRDRFESVSELEVMEKRSVYLKHFTQRNQTRQKQRKTRLKLALAMAQPAALPDALIEPDLSVYQRPLPDFDQLLEQILSSSPVLKQQQAALKQLKAGLSVIESRHKPKLALKLSTGIYQQDHRSRDKARAALSLSIPLLGGNQGDAERAATQVKISDAQARLTALEYQIREQVLDWTQRLEMLEQIMSQQTQDLEYRERALDKSRLLYEMEVRAQIGKAQGDLAKLIWQSAQAKFERALIWEQIDAVLGADLIEF